jgi:hypothetical protein
MVQAVESKWFEEEGKNPCAIIIELDRSHVLSAASFINMGWDVLAFTKSDGDFRGQEKTAQFINSDFIKSKLIEPLKSCDNLILEVHGGKFWEKEGAIKILNMLDDLTAGFKDKIIITCNTPKKLTAGWKTLNKPTEYIENLWGKMGIGSSYMLSNDALSDPFSYITFRDDSATAISKMLSMTWKEILPYYIKEISKTLIKDTGVNGFTAKIKCPELLPMFKYKYATLVEMIGTFEIWGKKDFGVPCNALRDKIVNKIHELLQFGPQELLVRISLINVQESEIAIPKYDRKGTVTVFAEG